MSDKPDPQPPDETEEHRFAFLDGCWEALQRGEPIDPQTWARSHPGDRERLGNLRLVRTLHDALQMVRADSRLEPLDPDATAPFLGDAGEPRDAGEPGALAPGLPADAPRLPGRVVGGNRLLRRLGGGGMGEVFEAEDLATGQRVALKLLAPHFNATPENVERFRREGRLASTIAHPRCVFVLAADEEAGQPYIVMELMPGDTLKDLVERDGPLPPAEAVRTILDVIDGLQAAHTLQVLHRDVKPSNCFLEADGRVKVGDFGLSKSLTGEASLTAAGTFLGTYHYASPEQLREPAGVDLRTDVYAVAATLYYLLTGQPPFADAVPTAVMMRKAAEPAPPLGRLRADIPAALERVVLRGLERDRERRWRDLPAFRQALLPFLPGHLSAGGLGMRVGALLIDYAILGVSSSQLVSVHLHSLLELLWSPILGLVYFVLTEKVWGCSLGKRLLRLRVCTAGGTDPPGLTRVVLRTLIFFALWLPGLVLADNEELWGQATAALGLLLFALGALLVVSTMRARNGYRGLHEFLSGTRVVQLPWPEKKQSLPCPPDRLTQLLVSGEALPERVGPFGVRGALAETPGDKILLGEDEALRRQVWIHLRTQADLPTDAVRREVRRPTRLRWLGGGRHDAASWDAFLAPTGCPLVDVIAERGPLSWPDARPLLEQLASELAAAKLDRTLPHSLTLAQVWVTPDGRLLLLDCPPDSLTPETDDRPGSPLPLLRQVATLALEGRLRPPDAAAVPVRAPLPLYASRLIDRVLGGKDAFANVEQAQAELAASSGRPAEVTPDWRAAHLAVQGALLFFGLLFMFIVGHLSSIAHMELLADRIEQGEDWLRILDDSTFHEDLRKGGIADLPRARQQVHDSLEQDRQQLAARRRFMRYTLEVVLPNSAERSNAPDPARQQVKLELLRADPLNIAVTRSGPKDEWVDRVYTMEDLRQRLLAPAVPSSVKTPSTDLGVVVTLVVISLLPGIWVVWAFLFRGGISLRLMGLALVRRGGRRAWRLQCAWRAFLVWAPVTALLLAASRLEWLSWTEGTGSEPERWLAWVGVACWWLAPAALAGYFLLAFRRPGRSLHDRLSGTYLVPR